MTKNTKKWAGAILLASLLAGITIALVKAGGERQVRLAGAGASFPYPVYANWMNEYHHLYGIQINYQSIGSGGGIAQIKKKTVDFGASDAPLKQETLNEAGLIQFPMIMGGVVPVVHLAGVEPGRLRLSRRSLAGIFLGTIRKWNDPALLADNPGLNLPNKDITVVHRADGSGTTWIFTNYLSKISPDWKAKVGTGKAVQWPRGIGGKGNEGVCAYVQRVPGSIGYVEFAYAVQNKLSYATIENREHQYVTPSIASFQASAANANWTQAPGFYMVLTDQPGLESWPITGASFILIHRRQTNCAKAKNLIKFFKWAYEHGGDQARHLNYVPVPANVVSLVEKQWKKQIRCQGKPVWK